ncbi:hypothetical protein EUX54_08225 [Haemophilus haemolyticus]|uniref:Uncharacterized protein n=1 Tax=Haemophilus haemolyticus TaxID=726 RepID=A0A502JEN1_HAEHA|nr:hypothetical protein [Haemophilus haemolyticus]TPG97767.1 hypothetical protein EUX54_08225 [Haemophilus haemolyticus]
MHRNLSGQTIQQKKNSEEQQRRRASIKAVSYTHCLLYTSPSPRDTERARMPSFKKAFELAEEQIREVEIKSLAITYYVYISGNKEKSRILRKIYRNVTKKTMTLDKLLKLLDKNYPFKEKKWDREILLDYLFFREKGYIK